MASESALVGATLSLSQAVTAYAFFLPSLQEVRHAPPNDPVMAGDVRMGQIAAGALAIGIGGIMASLSGSPLPVVISLAVSLIIAAMYEAALHQTKVGPNV